MPARNALVAVVLFSYCWATPENLLAQVRIILPPPVPQLPQVRVQPQQRLDANFRGSIPVMPLPRLDTSFPDVRSPVLTVEQPAGDTGNHAPPAPARQPNYQVKGPSPAPPPDTGDSGTEQSKGGLPSWLIWIVLGITFFLYLSRRHSPKRS